MNAIMRWGSGLLATLLFTSVSFGYYWVTPVTKCPIPQAPDACGPGFYVYDCNGMWYGPNYYLRPPFPPFQGMLPGQTGQALQRAQCGVPPWQNPGNPNMQYPQQGQQKVGTYPTHPYVRGPRDFFMWNEEMEENRGRDIRPNFVVP